MEHCTPKCMAAKMLIIGIVLILTRLYTQWDIWVVIGTILVVKAVLLFMMPSCKCQTTTKKKK